MVGQLWEEHHKAFSRFISHSSPTSVLEIGGGHGILAKEYRNFDSIPWIIVEPNPNPIQDCNVVFVDKFFDDKFSLNTKVDTVVHSHVFEHMYEPKAFMKYLSDFIDDGQHLIFSIPNMGEMLRRKYTNCLNFEHTVLLLESYVEYLLAQHGFRLEEKEYFKNDHSIFYRSIRDKRIHADSLDADLYLENVSLYKQYLDFYENLIRDINSQIKDIKGSIYLFGAHVFSQYLIAFGLDTIRISSIIDNDVFKQGRRLYGTRLMVNSPQVLEQLDAPVVILRAGVYNQEIKNQILTKINKTTIFI